MMARLMSQDADLCVARWGLVANTGAGQPVSVSKTLPFFIQDADGAMLLASSCSFVSRTRRRSTARTAVLSSKALTNAGEQPTRPARRHGRTCGVTFGGKLMLGRGLGDNLSARKVKAHTTLEAMLAGVISVDDQAGNGLADAACQLVVLEHRATQPVGTLMRSGPLGVSERLRGGASARDPGPCRCQRSRPSSDVTLCQHPERTTLGRRPGASGARARGAALQLQLDDSAGQRIVDLLQGGKVVSVLCAVCGSCRRGVVRRSLLSNCPVLGKFCVPSLVHFAPGAISCHFSARSLFLAAAFLDVLIELAPMPPKIELSFSVAVLQPEQFMSCAGARPGSTVGSATSEGISSDEEVPGQSNMWGPLLEAAYHHSIGAFLATSMCHRSKAALSQSCHFALFVKPVARASTARFLRRAPREGA